MSFRPPQSHEDTKTQRILGDLVTSWLAHRLVADFTVSVVGVPGSEAEIKKTRSARISFQCAEGGT